MSAQSQLPPVPIGAKSDSYAWQDYQIKLRLYLNTGTVVWANVDKTGSNITDIATRLHNSLQAIQGGGVGDYNHLTTAQVAKVNGAAPLISPAFTTSVGFNGSTAITKPTITGSRGANAALANLLTQLANYGLITDSTTV